MACPVECCFVLSVLSSWLANVELSIFLSMSKFSQATNLENIHSTRIDTTRSQIELPFSGSFFIKPEPIEFICVLSLIYV